jgi:signal peptidase II
VLTTGKKFALFSTMVGLVIILDQLTKYKVRTDPSWQYVDLIPGWLGFHYTLNPGMAMGIDVLTTPMVSMISITAAMLILAYVIYSMKTATTGFAVLMGLVMGGAFGNIIDRIFLGPIQGFEGMLQGRVVDFIHFYYRIGDFDVFPYIFNVADMAISVSLVTLIVFHKRFMPDPVHEAEQVPMNELEASLDPEDKPAVDMDAIRDEAGFPIDDPFGKKKE